MKKTISIIIRTLNEEKYLDELLNSIKLQNIKNFLIEIILVDSGSNDKTLSIAKKHKIKITHIEKKNFTFGRSLNMGCDISTGDILVFISGHCVPIGKNWLIKLINPIFQGFGYSYGRQIGRDTTPFSESQVFLKQYPKYNMFNKIDFFCNNANAAISKQVWIKYKFNETITGCEDMELAKRYVSDGGRVCYVPNAIVYHIHNEDWKTIRRRYEREAFALKDIIPEVNITKIDFVHYLCIAFLKDFYTAFKKKIFFKTIYEILRYRFEQYYGSYIGNHLNRKLTSAKKLQYFYPRKIKK